MLYNIITGINAFLWGWPFIIFIIFIVGIFAKNYYEFIYIFGKLFQILTEKKLKTRVLREMQGVCFIYG